MKYLILLLFLAITIHSEKIVVSLYIESLCPDTTRFIQSSLMKALNTPQFDELVQLKFVPYGKATQQIDQSGNTVFKCQHGDVECFGNKLQSCGFKALETSQTEQLQFLTCIQKTRKRVYEDFEEELKACLPDLWDGVLQCTKGTDGIKLLWDNGEETQNLDPKLTYVPWVTVNGQFDSKAHQIIERNIVEWVCKEANRNSEKYTQIEACDEYS